MNHRGIVRHLGLHLQQGLGINEALAELGLTIDYIAKRCKRTDRVRLHQAHSIYRERLNREVVQRARVGRMTGALKQIIDDLPVLILPGDDEDEEQEYRKWRRRNFSNDFDHTPVTQTLADVRRYFESLDDEDDDDCEDEREEGEADVVGGVAPVEEDPPPRPNGRPRKHLPPDIELPEPDPEPPPEPKVHWCRLFTGRAVLRDEDGKVVRSVMPGQPGYPHDHQFINWD